MTRAVRCVQSGFVLPAPLTDFIRTQIIRQAGADLLVDQPMQQLDGTDDIWFTNCQIPEHTDRKSTDKCMTSGIVLINDAEHELVAGVLQYLMPPGTVFQINSSQPHATVGDDTGLFAFMAWDSFPVDVRPAKEFAMEAVFSLTWVMRNLGMKSS